MHLTTHIFCCPASRELLEMILEGADAGLFTDWADFADKAPNAHVLVAVLDLVACVSIQDVIALRRACSHVPFILCVPRGTLLPDDVDFDRSVRRGLVSARLRDRIRHHQFGAARTRLCDFILDGDHDLQTLREPLARWLHATPPPRTATKAAAIIGWRLKAVESAFREEVKPAGGTSLKRCIDSIVLYRACEILALGETVSDAAEQLRLSKRTLMRMARRAWDASVADLPVVSPSGAVHRLCGSLGLDGQI